MFSKIAILATFSLALSAAAVPFGSDFECNTDKIYCCNQVEGAQTDAGAKIIAVLGAAAQGVTGLVGAQCTPISFIALSKGASCAQQTICCKDNYNNGAVVSGCNAINAPVSK